MSEIPKIELQEVIADKIDNYRFIQPEKELSVKEINDLVAKEYNKAVNEAKSLAYGCMDGERKLGEQEARHFDDNGKLYRVGNDLLPNCLYELNGYKYQTDDAGRIISAEGELHLKGREGRLPIKDSLEDIGKGDQKEDDDRGHLIGDQFDGSNGLENLIPQDAEINRNDFKNFENELAKEVKDGKIVYDKVEPVYEGDSRRPIAIVVTYSIAGEESVRVFPNGKEK